MNILHKIQISLKKLISILTCIGIKPSQQKSKLFEGALARDKLEKFQLAVARCRGQTVESAV